MKKINPLEVVQEQYQHLKEKLRSTHDVREMKVIIKRLINLVEVMQFLISISNNTHLTLGGQGGLEYKFL
jgi:hypothetical protein